MSEKRSRTVEVQEGIGQISIDDTHYEVNYDIKIVEEYWIGQNKKNIKAQSAVGKISPTDGSLKLEQGEVILLHLKDGRVWKCRVKSGNPMLGWYQLVDANPLGVYKPKSI